EQRAVRAGGRGVFDERHLGRRVAVHLVGDALGVHQLQRVDDVAILGEGDGGKADRARGGRGGGQGQSLSAGQVHGWNSLISGGHVTQPLWRGKGPILKLLSRRGEIFASPHGVNAGAAG